MKNQMVWTVVKGESLGMIPSFLSLDDPDSAVKQLDKNYQHGGGWHPLKGMRADDKAHLHYPGDPPYKPIGVLEFRDELVVVYECSLVAVFQRDGSFEVSRMD